MFRDRTNLYLSFRQSYTHHPYLSSQSAPLIDGDVIEMDMLPPSWMDISTQVESQLQGITSLIGRLAPLHKKHALPGFDDRSAEEREIEQLTLQITQGLHRCQALVKKFEALSHQVDANDQALIKMCNNMKVAMAGKVQDTSAMFRKMQSSYLKVLRKDPTYASTGSIEQDVQLSRQALEQTQDLIHDEQDAEVRQREQEINKIAQAILEVADIFKDLQTMVIDQGSLVDRIDFNVETMYQSVKDADRELVKGERYQKRTTKCKIILLLSLIILALFLILILKPRHHSSSSYSAPPPQEPAAEPPSSNDDSSVPALI